jgi:hypothetical protein
LNVTSSGRMDQRRSRQCVARQMRAAAAGLIQLEPRETLCLMKPHSKWPLGANSGHSMGLFPSPPLSGPSRPARRRWKEAKAGLAIDSKFTLRRFRAGNFVADCIVDAGGRLEPHRLPPFKVAVNVLGTTYARNHCLSSRSGSPSATMTQRASELPDPQPKRPETL